MLTFYHGAANKYETLKPVVYSGGHLLRKYSWSIFLFHQYKLALQWALFSTLDKIAEKLKLNYPVYRYERLGFDDYNTKIGIKINELEKFLKYIKCNNVKCYVYTVEINNISKLGLGNTDCQPEYTYDEEIKPTTIDTVKITETTIKENVFGLDDEHYYDWLHNRPNMRGILAVLYNNKKAMREYGHVWNEVKNGKLKPGNDLDPVIKSYYNRNEAVSMNCDEFDDFLFESLDFDTYFDIVVESSNKLKRNKKRKKLTKADIAKAKQLAYQQILQSVQYRNAVRNMNTYQRREVQLQIQNRIDDNIRESKSFFDEYPYVTLFGCAAIAIAGTAWLATYTVGKIVDLGSFVANSEIVQDSLNHFFSANSDIFPDGAIDTGLDMVDLDLVDAIDVTDIGTMLV